MIKKAEDIESIFLEYDEGREQISIGWNSTTTETYHISKEAAVIERVTNLTRCLNLDGYHIHKIKRTVVWMETYPSGLSD